MQNNQKKRVLVVEDDSSIRNILADKINYDDDLFASTANDGEEGLAVSIREKPDLILLDVIMPKMNGLKMLQKLREDPWGKTVPVILLSNDDDPEHIRNALQDDVTDYLVKSDFELENIVKKIKEILII